MTADRTPMEDEMNPMIERLYATDDAAVWAEEFCKVARERGHDLDEGWVIGWFANAMQTAINHTPAVRAEHERALADAIAATGGANQ